MPVVTRWAISSLRQLCYEHAGGSAGFVPVKEEMMVAYRRRLDGTPGHLLARVFIS
jgi:hypothetical protein